MQSKELSHERKNQEAIITELVGMTDILKETTIKIHNSVKRQNHVRTSIDQSHSSVSLHFISVRTVHTATARNSSLRESK